MGVMFQFFEYDISYNDHLWRILPLEAQRLSTLGISALWLPPAFKGASGTYDVGYGPYDLYDLGEFYQKGTVPTKYGTKEEYLHAIEVCHHFHIAVYPDVVLNHKMGSDDVNLVKAVKVNSLNRLETKGRKKEILAATQFNYDARNNQYSAFKWTADHFTGVDYDAKRHSRGIYLFEDKQWSNRVDDEFYNYDYLMGCNIDHNYPDVREELVRWGRWYKEITHLDGFRLDAIKHIDYDFYKEWLYLVREHQDLFAVGEYWSGEVNRLTDYLENVEYSMSLFDVPLHYRFYEASKHPESYDLRYLFKDTLVEKLPEFAVTFVDNHDTQRGQGLSSFVHSWFKPFAYALILLRYQGYPCIFYGDFYGLKKGNFKGIQEVLEKLLLVRRDFAHGNQHEYITSEQYGFSREAGLAVLMNIRNKGYQRMYVGRDFHTREFCDIFSLNHTYIDEEGYGDFVSNKKTLAVYVVR